MHCFLMARATRRVEKIRILLADDNAAFRKNLGVFLELGRQFTVVGHARNGREAVEMTRKLRPAVVLMDVTMPLLNGLMATKQIVAGNPASKVLILSMHSSDEYADYAAAVGAVGFLEKTGSPELVTKAILSVLNGNKVFGPTVRNDRPAGLEDRTPSPRKTAPIRICDGGRPASSR